MAPSTWHEMNSVWMCYKIKLRTWKRWQRDLFERQRITSLWVSQGIPIHRREIYWEVALETAITRWAEERLSFQRQLTKEAITLVMNQLAHTAPRAELHWDKPVPTIYKHSTNLVVRYRKQGPIFHRQIEHVLTVLKALLRCQRRHILHRNPCIQSPSKSQNPPL